MNPQLPQSAVERAARPPPTRPAAVVVCGGSSRRMGRSKAWLAFGEQRLLTRVVTRVAPAADPVLVVAAAEQTLPELPTAVQVIRDPLPNRGPLMAVAAGLEHLAPQAPWAVVLAADLPFIAPQFVRRLYELRTAKRDAVVVRIDAQQHPLCSLYATRLHPLAHAAVAAGRLALVEFIDQLKVRYVDGATLLQSDALRRADGQLWSLRNINTPAQYAAALRDAAAERPAL